MVKHLIIKCMSDDEHTDPPEVMVINLDVISKLPFEGNFKFLKETDQHTITNFNYDFELYDIDWGTCPMIIEYMESNSKCVVMEFKEDPSDINWLLKPKNTFDVNEIVFYNWEAISFECYQKSSNVKISCSSITYEQLKNYFNE